MQTASTSTQTKLSEEQKNILRPLFRVLFFNPWSTRVEMEKAVNTPSISMKRLLPKLVEAGWVYQESIHNFYDVNAKNANVYALADAPSMQYHQSKRNLDVMTAAFAMMHTRLLITRRTCQAIMSQQAHNGWTISPWKPQGESCYFDLISSTRTSHSSTEMWVWLGSAPLLRTEWVEEMYKIWQSWRKRDTGMLHRLIVDTPSLTPEVLDRLQTQFGSQVLKELYRCDMQGIGEIKPVSGKQAAQRHKNGATPVWLYQAPQESLVSERSRAGYAPCGTGIFAGTWAANVFSSLKELGKSDIEAMSMVIRMPSQPAKHFLSYCTNRYQREIFNHPTEARLVTHALVECIGQEQLLLPTMRGLRLVGALTGIPASAVNQMFGYPCRETKFANLAQHLQAVQDFTHTLWKGYVIKAWHYAYPKKRFVFENGAKYFNRRTVIIIPDGEGVIVTSKAHVHFWVEIDRCTRRGTARINAQLRKYFLMYHGESKKGEERPDLLIYLVSAPSARIAESRRNLVIKSLIDMGQIFYAAAPLRVAVADLDEYLAESSPLLAEIWQYYASGAIRASSVSIKAILDVFEEDHV